MQQTDTVHGTLDFEIRKRLKTRCIAAGVILLLASLVSSCRVMQSTADLPMKAVNSVTGKKGQLAVDPVEVQQHLLRFADEYTARIVAGVELLRRGTNALDRVELLRWKLVYAGDTLAIASGQNAVANLLDMLVLTAMTRIAIEEQWMPKVYGESARPLLESCVEAEEKIWRLSAPALKPTHVQELREAIRTASTNWGAPQLVSHVRALGLATQSGKKAEAAPAEQSTTSVFSLFGLDPLAGLDPAAREIARTRLFAERALYVAQRMPLVLRYQAEMLSYQMAATPEVGQVLTNMDRFGQSAEALTRTTDALPRLVNEQREAAIKQVFEGLANERTNLIASLASEEMRLRSTLVELRQTLDAGTALMKSSDATTKSIDTFLARFDKGSNTPPVVATNTRPFDILDYATTAKEVTTTLNELSTALNSLDKAMPQIQLAGETIESAGKRLMTRLTFIGVGLIAFFFVGAVTAALLYRRLLRSAPIQR